MHFHVLQEPNIAAQCCLGLMHPLNRYQERPDFAKLAKNHTNLEPYLTYRDDGYATIDFQNAAALRALTRALLLEDFSLDVALREDRLCPTIANRLDYLLMILDLEGYLTNNNRMTLLDIGCGAYAIYGLLMSTLRPDFKLLATEIDATSLQHSRIVIERNDINMDIKAVGGTDPILKPLFDGSTATWTICNPPFFSSREEMHAGNELKTTFAPAGPTAADNELITPGGEVAFVSQIMLESLEVKDKCQWFTTLLGKLSSVGPLVDFLRSRKIDNYFLRSSKQSRTVRWILGWSFGDIRLPDSLTRPPDLSLSRHVPISNEFSFTPRPAVENLKKLVVDAMVDAKIPFDNGIASPLAVTWTRQARRKVAQGCAQPSTTRPILVATFESTSTTLTMRWTRGRDRAAVESLWVFIVRQLRVKHE